MKRRKLIGITIIVASILLQVGYATTIGQSIGTVSTKALAVDFLPHPIVTHDEHIEVQTTLSQGVVDIVTNNLYPGGKFGVRTTVENSGEYSAVITDVKLIEKEGEGLSHELFEALVGYKDNQSIQDYSHYLQQTYTGKVLKKGETLDIPLEMGMAVEETGLQNETTQFSLILQFKQEEGEGSGSSDGGSGGGNGSGGGGSDLDKVTPDEDTTTPETVTTLPKLSQPKLGQPVEGRVMPEAEPTQPEESITPEEASILPQGGLLPKTGGMTPSLVYGLGIALLGGGIMIYRKKDE